jgi:hypothetical protein
MSGVSFAEIYPDGFDSSKIEPNATYDDLPAGDYPSVITDSVKKPTKAGNGSYIEFAFEVIDGPMAGRKFWDRLNTDNPNVMTREIATKTMSAIARAVGIFGPPKSTLEMHDKPIQVSIKYKDGNARYTYSALSGSGAVAPAGNTASAPVAANTAAPAKKPWER